jgi:hypothetical protein
LAIRFKWRSRVAKHWLRRFSKLALFLFATN